MVQRRVSLRQASADLLVANGVLQNVRGKHVRRTSAVGPLRRRNIAVDFFLGAAFRQTAGGTGGGGNFLDHASNARQCAACHGRHADDFFRGLRCVERLGIDAARRHIRATLVVAIPRQPRVWLSRQRPGRVAAHRRIASGEMAAPEGI